VYAVEKNPNAVVHIQQMLRREGWGDRVRAWAGGVGGWVVPLSGSLTGSLLDSPLTHTAQQLTFMFSTQQANLLAYS
jgi:protein arginine N-methyltransferase 5